MTLRDKIDRYASVSQLKGRSAERTVDPSLSATCEHTKYVFPPEYRHGVLRIESVGGHFGGLAKLLAQSPGNDTLDFERMAFVDTETTGLSGGIGVCAFLVGVGYRSSDGFVVEQFLMNDFPAEPHLLRGVCETIDRFDVVVSYNGRAFDVPILDGRLLLNGIKRKLSDKPHLDLLHPARRLWKHRLSDCSLKSLEAHVLDYLREDDIDGWMIPPTYFEYLRTGDTALLDPVVRHNRLDIVSLACVAHLIFSTIDAPREAPFIHGLDWYGLGTFLERHRRTKEAVFCFEKAMTTGLPEETISRCQKTLSLMCKRKGDWEEAVRLWEEGACVSGDASHSLFALEELAKFYEHRRRDLSLAREICHRAIAMLEMRATISDADVTRFFEDFEYRLRRIERKLQKGNA